MTAINATGTPSIPTTSSSLTLANGLTSAGSNQFFTGKIHEVMMFSGELNDHAIRRLEGYLAHKWGGQTNLVAGHPYKSSRPQFGGTQSITLAHTNVPVDSSDNLPFMSIFDSAFILEGSFSTSGLPLVYTTNNASVLRVNASGLLEPVASGNVTVTVSQPGDSHFSAASSQTLAMKIIGKRPQTLTFADISDQQLGQTVDLNASSSSGLAVSFSVTDGASIASITGQTVSFSGTGSVTIQASQDGNDTYAAAPSVSKSFTVKRPLALTFNIASPKGKNDVFDVKAIVLDGITNQPISESIAPTPTYSIESGGSYASLASSLNADKSITVTCGENSGSVTLRAVVSGPSFVTTTKSATFSIDASKSGQTITFKQGGEKGGLRDLPLSRKPLPIGLMAQTTAMVNGVRLPLRFEIPTNPKNVASIKGTGPDAVLVLADPTQTNKFSGFDGQDYLEITIRAISDSSSAFHDSYTDATIRIKAPSKSAFFEERRMDSRYDSKKTEFITRLNAKGITGDKAIAMFDSDNFDSDGDGISNALERAFGGDSLNNDSRDTLPKPIKSKPSGEEDHEFITFLKYQDNYNTEGIEYIVETSRDLRTWLPDSDADGAIQEGTAVEVDGGMERVVWKTKQGRTDGGNDKIFIRVRVKTR